MSILVKISQSFFLRLFGMGLAFLSTLLVAKVLPFEESGRYFYIMALIIVIASVSHLGLKTTVVRYISASRVNNDMATVNGLSIFALGLSLLVSFTSVVLIYCLQQFFFKSSNDLFNHELLLLMIPILSFNLISSAIFQAFNSANIAFLIEKIISLCVFSALIIYFAINDVFFTSAIDLLKIMLVALFLVSIFSLIFLYRYKLLNGKKDFTQTKKILKSSKPVFIALVMTLFVEWGGQIALGVFSDKSDVAIMAVAQRLASFLLIMLVAVNYVAAPKFAECFARKDNEALKTMSMLCSRMMLIVVIPLSLIMIVFANEIMFFFGEDYLQGSIILRILIVGQTINVICGSVGYLLNMTGHEIEMRNCVIISGSISILLFYFLVPAYGLIGAAITTAVSISSHNILAVIYVKKRLGFNTLKFIN